MVFLVVIFFMSVSFAPLSASNGKLIASRQGDRPSHTISAVNRLVQSRTEGGCVSRSRLELPRTLGLLRKSTYSELRLGSRTVKDELRQNLICKIQRGESLFPGILGYEDTVVPQVVNAVLSRHHFILLGLRGQAKTRLIRLLTTLLDEWTPYLAGCEIHDNPYAPICRRCRDLVAAEPSHAPIAWLHRDHRYVEK